MKNLKIVFASLLLAAGAISIMSFVSNNFDDRAFARTCYRINLAEDLFTEDVNEDEEALDIFANAANWSTGIEEENQPEGCDAVTFVCAICFDPADYNDDPELPALQEALNALKTAIENQQETLSHTGVYFQTSKPIHFYEKEPS